MIHLGCLQLFCRRSFVLFSETLSDEVQEMTPNARKREKAALVQDRISRLFLYRILRLDSNLT